MHERTDGGAAAAEDLARKDALLSAAMALDLVRLTELERTALGPPTSPDEARLNGDYARFLIENPEVPAALGRDALEMAAAERLDQALGAAQAALAPLVAREPDGPAGPRAGGEPRARAFSTEDHPGLRVRPETLAAAVRQLQALAATPGAARPSPDLHAAACQVARDLEDSRCAVAATQRHLRQVIGEHLQERLEREPDPALRERLRRRFAPLARDEALVLAAEREARRRRHGP